MSSLNGNNLYEITSKVSRELPAQWTFKPFVDLKTATKEQNCEDLGTDYEDFLAFEWPGTVKGCYEPPKGTIIDNSKEVKYHQGGNIFPISDLKDENDCKFVIDALPP